MLNTGFAVRVGQGARARRAARLGHRRSGVRATSRSRQGDQTCRDNQALHGEAVNLLAKVRANSHYVPSVADPLAPTTFVNKIKVPVFMACQWTDEQTGGHCADLAEHMTGTRRKWFTFTNGNHIDSLDPATFNRWYDFLTLYVAQQSPMINSVVVHGTAPVVYQAAMGISGVSLPADPIQSQPTYAGALAAFEQLPSVRVLFDSGAGGQPGYPVSGLRAFVAELPDSRAPARAAGSSGPAGALASRAPAATGVQRLQPERAGPSAE